MDTGKNIFWGIILVVVTASSVFLAGNYDIFTNRYLINDDVRQQLFWMERWQDPELFQNDFLTSYSEAYVPVGVKAIYRIASVWFDPLFFSKVLTIFLFVITAVLLFIWSRLFGDKLTAFLVVVVYFLFTGFQAQMSGGLSRGFVFPLLIAYLYFISRGDLFKGGLVVLLQSFLNAYVFLLCLFTQALIVSLKIGARIFPRTFHGLENIFGIVLHNTFRETSAEKETKLYKYIYKIFLSNVPIIIGVLFTVVNVLWYQASMGHLINSGEMIGKSEYSEFGRYQLYPIASFFHELIRPWIFSLSFPYWGAVAGWTLALVTIAVFGYAAINYKPVVKWDGLAGLFFLIPVSFFLYFLARLFLIKLFVPRRYIFYTLTIIYCIGFALSVRIILETIKPSRAKIFLILAALLVLASLKGRHIGFFDYSQHESLYRFVQTTPKTSLIAGWPDIMDNAMTFGKRRAFVTYELSHTWVEPYWSETKKRTFDFFRAYYSSTPDEIKAFCKLYGIEYLIVRDEDFSSVKFRESNSYFEPFNGFVWYLLNSNQTFAILDRSIFPPVFEANGIRLIPLNQN